MKGRWLVVPPPCRLEVFESPITILLQSRPSNRYANAMMLVTQSTHPVPHALLRSSLTLQYCQVYQALLPQRSLVSHRGAIVFVLQLDFSAQREDCQKLFGNLLLNFGILFVAEKASVEKRSHLRAKRRGLLGIWNLTIIIRRLFKRE